MTSFFDVLESFENSKRERNLESAHTSLRELLSLAVRSLEAGQADRANYAWPLSPPFGAVAAIVGDPKTFDLMDSVALLLGDDAINVAEYREDAVAIAKVRVALERSTEVQYNELQRMVAPAVRGRLWRLLAWMEKYDQVGIVGSGSSKTVRAGAVERARPVLAPTFRAGQIAVLPTEVWLHEDEEEDEEENEEEVEREDEHRDVYQDEDFAGTRLNVPDRLPGVMSTHPLRDGVWLVGRGKTSVSGAGETKIVVKTHTGETLREFLLPTHVVRVFSSFQREHIIVLDARLDVFVLNLMGEYVKELSLASNPEVLSVLQSAQPAPKPRAAIRGLDISPNNADVLFSVVDRIWRFTKDGALRSAQHLERGDPPEADQSVTFPPGKALDFSRNLDLYGADWIYFARILDRDNSTLVSTYHGHLVKFGPSGELDQHWNVDGPAEDVLETDEGLVVSTEWSGGWFLNADGSSSYFPYSGKFLSESLLVGYGTLFNPTTGAFGTFPTRGLKGTYLVDGSLRVEATNSYLDVDVP